MTVKFERHDVPIAHSMLEAASKLDPEKEWYHPYHKYFYYWAAFNNIYTTIAFTGSRSPELLRDSGNVVTERNGNVDIPKINHRAGPSEREQIKLAFEEFDDDLKHKLISHPKTEFFVNRNPRWQEKPISTDVLGQRLNGVLNVNFTVDVDYPIWSPIDFDVYPKYLKDPKDAQARNFLAKQILDMLYTIRCNLMHGKKQYDDRNDVEVINSALPLLEIIVLAFTK